MRIAYQRWLIRCPPSRRPQPTVAIRARDRRRYHVDDHRLL